MAKNQQEDIEYVRLNFALKLFCYQARYCKPYKEWVEAIGCNINEIEAITQIPFLPIEVFKYRKVYSLSAPPEVNFRSSATGGVLRSNCYVASLSHYHHTALQLFCSFSGTAITDSIFFALLPNYLSQGDSSLVAMVDYFMDASGQPEKHFYLDDFNSLILKIKETAKTTRKQIILFGVTYALLDCLASFGVSLPPDVIIIETGGMKGRGKELLKQQVRAQMLQHYNTGNIASEYGMTELLSQCYAVDQINFKPAISAVVLVRQPDNPLSIADTGNGAINIIDFANIDTCSFIATQDQGTIALDGTFSIDGRLDNADIRGCNQLYTNN